MNDHEDLSISKTHAEWRRKVLLSLGGMALNTELGEQELDHAIWETLTLFNKYRPKMVWIPLGPLVNRNQINMQEAHDLPRGVNITDVKFMDEVEYAYRSMGYPFHLDRGYWGFCGMQGPRQFYKELVARDRYRSFMGTQPSWQWDPNTRILHIEVPGVNRGTAFRNVKATALALYPLTVVDIPMHLENDFLRGVVGHAKMILGRQLSKYGPIPSAQGDIELDGDSLKSEGKEAVEELERRLDRNPKRAIPRPIF